jgi:phosphoglycolate phosphatase
MSASNQPSRDLMRSIRGVILDLDGTMLDTGGDLQRTVNRMRDDLALAPLAAATVTSFVGKGAEHLVRCALRVDLPEQETEQLHARAMRLFNQHYHDINGQFTTLYPNVIEGLQAMQSMGLRLACVTNKPLPFTLPLMAQTGLRDFFDLIYGGDSFARKKPDPMAMLQVCADFAFAPAQMLAIGDSINDAQAARAAGCRIVMVPYGYNHGQSVQEIDSDGIVSSLLEAAQLISH